MNYTGTVVGGSAKANALGYPTANIPYTDKDSGIYAARVVVEGKEYRSVAYADPSRQVLEAHLFGFSGDLYGKEITVTLVEKIREKELFPDDVTLKEAMTKDAARAEKILS